MKNLFLIALLTFIFLGANAQDEEFTNKYVLGGSISFLSQDNTYPFSTFTISTGIGGIFSSSLNESKNARFAISPYIGKEVNPNWLVGLQFDIGRSVYKVKDAFFSGQTGTGEFERKTTQFGFGAFARYMFNPENKLIFFLQPSMEYNILREDELFNSILNQEEKTNYFEGRINLGMLYNINEKYRVTVRSGGLLFVKGKWRVIDSDDEMSFSSFSANLNLSNIALGFEMRI